jgi:hypothetical protein
MKGVRVLYLALAVCAFLTFSSCGGGGDGGGTPATGTLSLGLTDHSTDHYKAFYVTIDEVQVHMGGDTWKVVATPNKTCDLLVLVNGVREELGVAELNAGDYTQMRLIIGETPDAGINLLSQKHPYANYVLGMDDQAHELKVPSGYQTGVKIVQGFTINANQTTELLLDFSASESVVEAGKNKKWLLKPTIKVLNTRECSIISGTVDEGAGQFLPGVLISAQMNEPGASDLKDRVVTEASTLTAQNGQYKLFVKPGTYQIVASRAEYDPQVECSLLLEAGKVYENHNFTLNPAPIGTVSGDVIVTGPDPDQYATISFRQLIDCSGDGIDDTEIEVDAVNIMTGESYTLSLPEGTYHVVESSYGVGTVDVENFEVPPDTITDLDVNL